MELICLIKVTYKSLTKQKLKSFLSVLGIIIGVLTVVIMTSISEGFREYVMNEYNKVGHNLMWVIPKNSDVGDVRGQLVEEDLSIFYENEFVDMVSPYTSADFYMKRSGREGVVKIVGVNSSYDRLRLLNINGRFINDNDIVSKSNVCVISDEVRKNYLYQNISPIGEKIQVDGVSYVVIGCLAESQSNTKTGLDDKDSILIPYSAFERNYGTKRIDMVLFSVKDPEKSEKYSAEIQQKLLSRKSGNLQVRIDSIYKNMKNVSIIFMVATLGAAVITSVGLIVSGIGIMNVLLMSIAERKWEIGLRKAVGADNKSILLQFLMESILLCIMGALIGLLLSVGIIEVLSFFAKLSIKISWVSVVISVGFCSFVGVFFGIFPAIKASKLDPLECLEQ